MVCSPWLWVTFLELESLVDEVGDLVEDEGCHDATKGTTNHESDDEGDEVAHATSSPKSLTSSTLPLIGTIEATEVP